MIAVTDADRDRDARGRPRNARPRDALGRPLAPGAAGVPGVPEALDLGPDDTLTEAQRLLDEGFPFQAHEVLEAAWKGAPAGERDLWQGLAQLAVGLTHALRGNPAGARALLTRAVERVLPYRESAPHGIDVDGLIAWAETARRDADGQPAPPRLRVG